MTKIYSRLIGFFCATSENDEEFITNIHVFEYNLPRNTLERYEHYKINEADTNNEHKLELNDAIDKLEAYFLKHKDLSQESCLCTFGPHFLRTLLHPECFRKGIDLSDNFYAYFDLQNLSKTFFGLNNIDYIVQQSLTSNQRTSELHARIALVNGTDILRALKRFRLKNGYGKQFCLGGKTGKKKGDVLRDDLVVKTRGLPWNSTESDVANFFKGLNIEKGGVALCMYSQGKRNGEALVSFESKEHKCLALKRHKHHLGSRYIEVFRATGKEFVQCLATCNKEAHALLMEKYDFIDPVIIRMRGLPFTCREPEVVKFFQVRPNECDILDGEGGVLLIYQSEGKTTGDAFVLFANEDEATKAMSKHKHCIGLRYIELFRSTVTEIQQVLDRNFDPRLPRILTKCNPHLILPHPPKHFRQFQNTTYIAHRSYNSDVKDCVKLFGLPPSTSINDLVFFLSDHVKDIRHKGIHFVFDSQGTHTGEVYIEVVGERQAEFLQENKNGKMILVSGNRHYVHAHKCSASEMNNLLYGVNTNYPNEIYPGTPIFSVQAIPSIFCNYMTPHRIITIPSMNGLSIPPP